MGRYNDELAEAGVLLDLAGLLPSASNRSVSSGRSTGRRIRQVFEMEPGGISSEAIVG